VAARAGLAAIQIELQVFQRELKPWRAAVNDSDQCRAVAFTSSGNSEQLAVGIAGHAGRSAKISQNNQTVCLSIKNRKHASIRRLPE
jgi:hypothetical protein